MKRPPTAFSSAFIGDLGQLDLGSTAPDQRYTVRGELGRGGMGVVYLAHDQLLDRDVALKRPRSDLPGPVREQVMREAALTATLTHPGIVPVLDAGEDDQGFYYTMPVLVGRTLQDMAAEASLADVVRVLVQVCDALGFAHSHDVVHRDVKPANLLVGDHGEVWVLDWGVALNPRSPAHGPVGTEGFAAPEQCAGEIVGPAADVFAVGRTLQAVCPDPPEEIQSILLRALQANPKGRYENASVLGAELDAWIEGRRVSAHAYRPREVLRRWMMRRRLPLAVAGIGLSAVTLTGAAGLRAQLQEFERAEQALTRSLAVRAQAQRVDGDRAQAEWLAAEALLHGTNAQARGVLMQWSDVERGRRTAQWQAPCEGTLQSDGTWVCEVPGGVEAWQDGERIDQWAVVDPWPEDSTVDGGPALRQILWTREEGFVLAWGRAGFQSRTGLVRFDLPLHVEPRLMGPWGVRLTDWRQLHLRTPGGSQRLGSCALRMEAWDLRPDTAFALGCGEGVLWVGSRDRQRKIAVEHFVSAVRIHGDRVVVGSHDGMVASFGDSEDPKVWRNTESGAPVQIEILDDLRAVARSERGQVFTFDPETLTLLERLPGRANALGVRDGRLYVEGNKGVVETWSMPAVSSPVSFDFRDEGGVSSMQLSPDGSSMLVGHASGALHELSLNEGRRKTWIEEAPDVVKIGHWIDSQRIVLRDQGSGQLVDRTDGERQPVEVGPWNLGTVAQNGTFCSAHTKRVDCITDGTLRRVPGAFIELARGADGPIALTRAGAVVSLERPEQILVQLEDARRITATTARVLSIGPEGIRATAWDGTVLWRATVGQDSAVSLAATEDWVVVGGLNGSLTVLSASDGQPVGLVPEAHERRVSVLTIDGEVVYSASWDGMVRRWNLGGLETEASEIRSSVEEAFGVGPELL